MIAITDLNHPQEHTMTKYRYEPDRPHGCTCRTPIELARDALLGHTHRCKLHDAKKIETIAAEAERAHWRGVVDQLRDEWRAEDEPTCRCSTTKQRLAAALAGVEPERCRLHDPTSADIPPIALNDSAALSRRIGIPLAD